MVSSYSLKRCHCERTLRSNLLVALIFFLSGCVTAPPTPTADPVIEATSTPRAESAPVDASPTFAGRVRNAPYQLGIPDSLRVVQLTDGVYESGTPGGADYVSVSVLNFVANGDLNGDGTEEVTALVAENYGGSGTFVFLAVYADVEGTLTFLTSLIVDDRPQVNAMSIDNGDVYLDVVVHGMDDPMCCPTFRTARQYRLFPNNQLDIVDLTTFTPDGDPRTITIEAPPSGSDVYGAVQVRGSVTIAPFENNLEYHILDLAGVELSIGAVSVDSPGLGAPGTFDTVIKLGNILSGAVVRLEVRDVSAADGSTLAMDSIELVVK